MRSGTLFGLIAACVVVLASPVLAQPAEEAASPVDPKALDVVKAMSSFLSGLPSFTFKGEDAFDELLPGGQKVQFSNRRNVTVVRPDKLFGEVRGDTANRKAWFDGKTFALLNMEENVYSTEEIQGTIDALIEFMWKRYSANFPLSDFLSSDPYVGMTENLKTGVHLGVHEVDGVACQHVAFAQDEIDWQLWVEDGSKPLPRKFVITYKQEAGQPQYSWVFREWNISPAISAEAFHFVPPDGAERIEMIPVQPPTKEAADSEKEKVKGE